MFSACTKAIVVEISRSPDDLSRRSNVASSGTGSDSSALAAALRQRAAERGAALRMYFTSGEFSPGW
jgi:hypothetical protein